MDAYDMIPSDVEPDLGRGPTRSRATSDGGSTSYYKIPEGVKDLQDLIEYRQMDFALGNIFKAAYRLGQKDRVDPIYDINKIIYFAKRLKAQEENK